ncbi:hypothetical protein SDC9_164588 [bioreactor metagenome]|uniref:Uncharacterized protein n=1 Tax=bioreactor metagenome TaxID=1076179 RepID=A0A645FS22_9ZZZZ
MDTVITGAQIKGTVLNVDGAICVDRVVRRVNVIGAGVGDNGVSGLQSLCALGRVAGVVRSGLGRLLPAAPGVARGSGLIAAVGAPAACGHAKGAAVNGQAVFSLDTISACGNVKGAAINLDGTFGGILIIGGLDTVAGSVDGDGAARNFAGVAPHNAVVCRGGNGDAARHDFQVVL